MSKRLALVIGNSLYRDKTLSKLTAPDADVGALADTLLDPEMGGFDDVKLLMNMASHTIRREIFRFFDKKSREDMLLFYFSGHGILDDRGRLYLALKDTDTKSLRGTAVPARFITEEMDSSRSQRQVLILDCCHSGAFSRGTKGSPGASVGTASTFEGSGFGRVVLTATDATQYAWEGNQVIGEAENSLFTHYLVQGIQTGKADLKQDGNITVDELYDYAYSRILREAPKQTPGKWSFKEQGELIIAHTPTLGSIDDKIQTSISPGEQQEERIKQLYADGTSAFLSEEWDEALENFEAIAEIRPDFLDTDEKLQLAKQHKENASLYQRAMMKFKAGTLDESIQLFEKLLSQAPDYKDAAQQLDEVKQKSKLSGSLTKRMEEALLPDKAEQPEGKRKLTLPIIGAGIGGIIVVVVLVIVALNSFGNGGQEASIAETNAFNTSVALAVAAQTTDTPTTTPSSTPTDTPTKSPVVTRTPTRTPTKTPTPTETPLPPLYVRINNITRNMVDSYVVDYETFGYTETLPGMHVHFFFDTVPPEEAGLPENGPWILYGGPRPFTKYSVSDKPAMAEQMCALVAYEDHSIILESGNCYDLP